MVDGYDRDVVEEKRGRVGVAGEKRSVTCKPWSADFALRF
jgi:hypothetical protein